MATEALVFMVVGVKGYWKRPIGYFLGKADGMLQSQLVKHAVCLLSEKGFNVVGVTCDGSYANQATAKVLGCSLDVNKLKSSFIHPEDPAKEIHFIFDAFHLLKCARHCLGDLKVIKFRGHEINWSFIEALHNVQMKDDLHLANKISNKLFIG
ncbi:THAP domain containing 9 [Elysia marginata]|uniref:THAP domain containing 9 n=1 Tax=Elysia marginata TaxID=1093978 RepID=A0AAV4GYK4_9GAST|nr:THAP domain containing 9 [Elysia marginata]